MHAVDSNIFLQEAFFYSQGSLTMVQHKITSSTWHLQYVKYE